MNAGRRQSQQNRAGSSAAASQDKPDDPFPGAATARRLRRPARRLGPREGRGPAADPNPRNREGGAERPQPRRRGRQAGLYPECLWRAGSPRPGLAAQRSRPWGPDCPHADLKVPLSSRSSGGASARCLLWDMARRDGSAGGGRAVRSDVLAPRVAGPPGGAPAPLPPPTPPPPACVPLARGREGRGRSLGAVAPATPPRCPSAGLGPGPAPPLSPPGSASFPPVSAPLPPGHRHWAPGASQRPPLPALTSLQ